MTTLIGGTLALLSVKTDFKYKRLIDILCFISFAIPPYIIALSWMQIFGSNGYFERTINFILGSDNFYHSSPYSIKATIVVLSLHLYPVMFFSLKHALKNLDSRLEQVGRLSGLTGFKVFSKITLPLLLPSLFSTGLFIFSRALANFSVPALLCLPARIDVVPTKIYASLTMLDTSKAAFYSLVLVAFSSILYFLQLNVVTSTYENNFSENLGTLKFKKGKYLIYILFFSFFLIICILPAFSMIVSSFLKRWGLSLSFNNFTLDNYREILNVKSQSAKAFFNSLLFGGLAALFATLIGLSCAIISHYYGRRYKIFEIIASWPMAIPNTVLAVAAIFSWNRYPFKLYGSPWALIFTYMVLFTPIIINQVRGILKVQDINLLNVARMAGYNKVKAFIIVVLPFLFPGIRTGFVISIMIALREIPISVMLYSSNQETVGVLLFGLQSQSYGLEMTSALSVLVVIIVLFGNLLIKKRGRNE